MKRLYLLLALTKNDPTLETKDFIYNPNNINYTKDEKKYLENNKIILMTNDFSPPYTMKNKDKIEGIEIDYWKLINKKLKIKNINLKKIKRNTAFIKEIKNNKNLVKYTYNKKGLNENLKATNPITTIKIGLATQNDKAYLSNFSELNNKKIAIVKFSKIYQTFKTKYPKIKFITVKNLKEGFNLIKEKKVFGLIGKIPALSYHISNNRIANIKISGTFEEKFELKLLVDSSNEALLKLLNEAISIITDEEKNNIHSKYYSVILQTKTDYTWLYKVVLPLIAIIIFIILTNRKLNKEIKNRKEIELQLHKVANIDALTNIYNRRKIETLYNSEVKRVKRYKRELSIIFFDVDNFKLINDQLGHATGDYVLVKLASIIKNNIRSIDYFGRWGGEEFIIILAETNKEKAGNIAHVLKNKINQSDFNIDREVTCSFGVSQFEETDSADSLLTRADHAMYYIKRNGKNSVKIA